MMATLDRFMKHISPEPNSGCWLWTAGVNYKGYGVFNARNGITSAHRYSWFHHNGPIPEGLFVLHKCDNRCCANPDHLFIGTHMDNMADMIAKGRAVHVRGTDHKRSKLNPEAVLRIRSDRRISREIAADYNVDPSTINLVRRGVVWGHVPGALPAKKRGRKIDEQIAARIRADCRGATAVARDYGVDRNLVRLIRLGRIWRNADVS